jgi:uncharacterized membrane protein
VITLQAVFTVLFTAILPYLELRGAIPLAWHLGFPAPLAYCLAVLGNMIPVVPVMLLIEPLSRWLDHIPLFHKFFHWLFSRCRRHREMVNKYGFWGLTIFVALPLPMTGAWSGAIIAFLMGMRKRYAFFSIFSGVAVAGIILILATYGLARFFK